MKIELSAKDLKQAIEEYTLKNFPNVEMRSNINWNIDRDSKGSLTDIKASFEVKEKDDKIL